MDTAHEAYIGRLLRSDKSFYLFETITPAMQQVLDGIKATAKSDVLFYPLHLHGKAIELLTIFLEKLEKTFGGEISFQLEFERCGGCLPCPSSDFTKFEQRTEHSRTGT